MSKLEKSSIAVVSALLLSLACWQFSFAHPAGAPAAAPVVGTAFAK